MFENRADYLLPQAIDKKDFTTGAEYPGAWKQDAKYIPSLQNEKSKIASVQAKPIIKE
jgi:hypothetical protein